MIDKFLKTKKKFIIQILEFRINKKQQQKKNTISPPELLLHYSEIFKINQLITKQTTKKKTIELNVNPTNQPTDQLI